MHQEEVSLAHAVHVAVVDTLQDLLDAMGGVGLGVELPGDDVLEQLATRYAETREKLTSELK